MQTHLSVGNLIPRRLGDKNVIVCDRVRPNFAAFNQRLNASAATSGFVSAIQQNVVYAVNDRLLSDQVDQVRDCLLRQIHGYFEINVSGKFSFGAKIFLRLFFFF